MSTIGHFLYFINCVKDSLSFSDTEEFTQKIRNDFNFRLKVQKFVFIAKYFGWNHTYKYNLYIRGPYSSALADEYYNEDILNQINDYINYFADFGKCNNSIIVSGTLDYLSMVLENETMDLEMKNDLLELLSNYVADVEKIYDLCGGNPKVFEYMDLNSLENKFNRIQDYISQELGIFPRLYDSEFDLS